MCIYIAPQLYTALVRARAEIKRNDALGWLLLKAIVQRLTDFSTAREMRRRRERYIGREERRDAALSALMLESFCDRLSLWYFSFFGGWKGRILRF